MQPIKYKQNQNFVDAGVNTAIGNHPPEIIMLSQGIQKRSFASSRDRSAMEPCLNLRCSQQHNSSGTLHELPRINEATASAEGTKKQIKKSKSLSDAQPIFAWGGLITCRTASRSSFLICQRLLRLRIEISPSAFQPIFDGCPDWLKPILYTEFQVRQALISLLPYS